MDQPVPDPRVLQDLVRNDLDRLPAPFKACPPSLPVTSRSPTTSRPARHRATAVVAWPEPTRLVVPHFDE